MKKITIFIVLILITLSVIPNFSLAQTNTPPKLDYSGFVKCDGVLADKTKEPERQKLCSFAALIDTVNKAINWLFIISIPVAVALFAYGGLLYMTGTSSHRTKANNVFTSVGKGFIIMIVAWLGVYTVINWIISPALKDAATTFLDTK